MTLGCCRPNVLRLLLGVALANNHLNIFLSDWKLLANYSFGVNNREPYFQVSPARTSLIAGIESFQNRNWRQFPKVVVSGNWVPEGEELSVRRFNPKVAKAHHGVLKTILVDACQGCQGATIVSCSAEPGIPTDTVGRGDCQP